MNNNNEWVSVNLQRQRKILEDKQRQRRMQTNGIVSSNAEKSFPEISSAYSTGSTTKADKELLSKIDFDLSKSIERSSITTGITNDISKKIGENFPLCNSLYSLSNGGGKRLDSASTVYEKNGFERVDMSKSNSGYTQQFINDFSTITPKIITVKGFTPPQNRKQSDSGDAGNHYQFKGVPRNAAKSMIIEHLNNAKEQMVQQPFVNVDQFQQMNINSAWNSLEMDNDSSAAIRNELNRVSASVNNNKDKPQDRQTNVVVSGELGSSRPKAWKDYEEQRHLQNQLENIVEKPKNLTQEGCTTENTSTDLEEEEEDAIPTEVVNEENPISAADIIYNLDHFVMQPTRKNVTLKCKITRDKKGVDRGMYPIYYLHIEKVGNRKVFLLAARKRKKSTTANYLISTDPTDLSRNGKSFIAKIRSNAVGTEFTIYDKGENPKKASKIDEGIRQELASVIYETNVLGLKGPRKMIIIIPSIYVDEKHNCVNPLLVRPISKSNSKRFESKIYIDKTDIQNTEKDSILERYRTHRLNEMVVLNNKQPVWSEESQSYVLNFHGRVTQASVKNFQIVHYLCSINSDNALSQGSQSNFLSEEQNEYIVMQFGRIDNDNFTMDIRYPLSPVQAFGIAMTSFHKKLACD